MTETKTETWATLTVALSEDLADAADRLEEIGALLAMDPEIDGVQTLDPKYEPVPRPAMRIYTRPEALERVEATARGWMERHGLAAAYAPELRDDTQWQDLWKKFYRPLRFGGGRLLVRPSWIERTAADPATEIVLDPGRAFGTGLHPTTQLCVERLCALEAAGLRPASLLDLGCGSGILALCGLRLFPALSRCLAVDVDPEATETTEENAAANALAERLDVRTGDLRVLAGEAPFDVVVANIRPDTLIPMASPLQDHVVPGGQLTLSGILPEEAARVAEAYLAAGWRAAGPTREHEGWSSLDFERP